jgi:hypothetical protein
MIEYFSIIDYSHVLAFKESIPRGREPGIFEAFRMKGWVVDTPILDLLPALLGGFLYSMLP